MKRLTLTFLVLAVASPALAELIIHTKDGRTLRVPVEAGAISSIEFVASSLVPPAVQPPTTQALSPFLGSWVRKEGATVVEYLVVSQSGSDLALIFRERANGPVTAEARGRLQDGAFTGQTTNGTRSVAMHTIGLDQLSYTSTDPNGKNPWTGQYFRVK